MRQIVNSSKTGLETEVKTRPCILVRCFDKIFNACLGAERVHAIIFIKMVMVDIQSIIFQSDFD